MVQLSSLQKERTYSFCGTIEYMAPEIIRGKAGHGKVNIIRQQALVFSVHIILLIFVVTYEDL